MRTWASISFSTLCKLQPFAWTRMKLRIEKAPWEGETTYHLRVRRVNQPSTHHQTTAVLTCLFSGSRMLSRDIWLTTRNGVFSINLSRNHAHPASRKGRLELQMKTDFYRISEFEGSTDCLFLSSLVGLFWPDVCKNSPAVLQVIVSNLGTQTTKSINSFSSEQQARGCSSDSRRMRGGKSKTHPPKTRRSLHAAPHERRSSRRLCEAISERAGCQ